MRISLLALLAAFALIISGCGKAKPSVAKANLPYKAVTIQSVVPFGNSPMITPAVKNECKLETKLPDFIESYAKNNGIAVSKKAGVNKNSSKTVLLVTIQEAISGGNAFVGHRKYTKIDGTLYDGGKKVASFEAARTSGGGAFGGYKGSCSVLGRTVKTLGSDVAKWLTAPVDGAKLGDAR